MSGEIVALVSICIFLELFIIFCWDTESTFTIIGKIGLVIYIMYSAIMLFMINIEEFLILTKIGINLMGRVILIGIIIYILCDWVLEIYFILLLIS